MPYERQGKCVSNKDTGKSKGCSSSVTMAKRHMRALYANDPDKKKSRQVSEPKER